MQNKLSSNIKIAVIVPVYNVEIYLSRCLESIINQTLKDIEIICVNDCSTDSSLKILEEYVSKDSRIKIINLEQNQGQGFARNRGIELAKGEYIGFVDSDDYIDLDYFEKLYNYAKNNNCDIAVASVYKHKKNYNKYNVQYKEEKTAQNIQNKIELCKDKTDRFFYAWNKIYKTELIKNNNIQFCEGQIYEDVMFAIKALYYSNKVVSVPDTEYHYVEHGNSLVKSKNNRDKKEKDYKKAYKDLQEFCNDKNITLPEKLNYYSKKNYLGSILKYKGKYHKKYLLFGFLPILKIYDYSETRNLYNILGVKIKIAKKEIAKQRKENIFYEYKKNNVDITTIPPATGQLREIQLANLELLKELDYVCKQNNLTYMIDAGTLLGAVRHKGFIPWDDDIDTLMPRDSYNKIIEAFEKSSRNPDIFAGYVRDRITNGQYYIKIQHKKCPFLFVDVFPIDNYGQDLTKEEQLKKTKEINKEIKRLKKEVNKNY